MAHFPPNWWSAGRPLIFAHRGASRLAPENTLPAFQRAAELGADGVELDVHLTADGVPVVMHNAMVDATTDGSGRLSAMTLAEVKRLDAGAGWGPDFAGVQVPTLEEVLEAVARRLLTNIELKPAGGRNAGLPQAVVALIERLGLEDRVWFSSFKPYFLFAARRVTAEIPCGLLYSPLTPLTPLFRPVTPHEALHPHHSLVTPSFVSRAHRRGLRVSVWTVDDVAVARRLTEWGVDVLITNTPDTILHALR
ncbi:MAG: glycerophosphodiester phosphodiesterase [Anaerolineae bacterium]